MTSLSSVSQEIVELPDYNKITFKENPAIPLEEIVPDAPPQAVDLLYNFLVYPSKQRCSARQVRREPGQVHKEPVVSPPVVCAGITGVRPCSALWDVLGEG